MNLFRLHPVYEQKRLVAYDPEFSPEFEALPNYRKVEELRRFLDTVAGWRSDLENDLVLLGTLAGQGRALALRLLTDITQHFITAFVVH